MSNTIKLKRGSGSDPSASDLSIGEIAIRTDSGKLFTKKDNGSVAEISGSGGIDDGDKGDITVSNGGGTFTIDSGVINNAKVASDAAIAGSKIDADFGSQAISTTGTGSTLGRLTISNVNPFITLTDTNNDSDFSIRGASGNFIIRDDTNSAARFTVNSSGTVDVAGNLDVGSGVDVTGNITVSGTVDGRDVATDGTKLDGIESNATADQTASEILTLLKTVDGSGSGLDADTLDGIGSASFVRSNASDTLTGGTYTFDSSTDQKIILTGSNDPYIRFQEGSTNKAFIQWNSAGYVRIKNQEDNSVLRIKDNLEFSQDDSTFYDVWHAGNDGSGSGLDADTVDGIEASSFVRGDGTDNGATTIEVNDADFIVQDTTDAVTNFIWRDHSGNKLYIGTAANAVVTPRSNVVPNADSTYNLGASGTRWSNIYGDQLYGAGGNITGLNASNISSGTISASRIPTLNQDTTGSAATLTTARTIAGVSFDGSANISLNNNAITNGAGYLTSVGTSDIDNDAVTFAKLENVENNRILGRVSSGAGNAEELTQSQVRTLLGLATSATTDTTNASNIGSGTLNTARLPTTITHASNITIEATGGSNDLNLNAADHVIHDAGDACIFRGDSGADSYRFAKGGQTSIEGFLSFESLSTDRTFTFPDTTGTVALTSDIPTNNNELSNGAGYITATLTNEQVQDIVGGMLTGNTETGITVTYQDGDGTIDFVVGTLNQDTTGNAASASTVDISGISTNAEKRVVISNDADGAGRTLAVDSSSSAFTYNPSTNVLTAGTFSGSGASLTSLNASNISSGTIPDARFPSTLPAVDGSNLTGISAGATGGGSDEVFYENDQTVTTNYTITNGKNAMAAGPIEIQNGVTVTVGSGETLTIV